MAVNHYILGDLTHTSVNKSAIFIIFHNIFIPFSVRKECGFCVYAHFGVVQVLDQYDFQIWSLTSFICDGAKVVNFLNLVCKHCV